MQNYNRNSQVSQNVIEIRSPMELNLLNSHIVEHRSRDFSTILKNLRNRQSLNHKLLFTGFENFLKFNDLVLNHRNLMWVTCIMFNLNSNLFHKCNFIIHLSHEKEGHVNLNFLVKWPTYKLEFFLHIFILHVIQDSKQLFLAHFMVMVLQKSSRKQRTPFLCCFGRVIKINTTKRIYPIVIR